MTDEELFDRVRKLVLDNMITGGGKDKPEFHFTRPSPERYPYQFFWDTCFHAFILCGLGEAKMAQKHLQSLFAFQEDDGFVGHMIYWDRLRPGRVTDLFQSSPGFSKLFKSHMSSIIQPPIVAQAVERVYNLSQEKEFLEDMLPKLKAYYDWLAQNRDFDGDGLLSIISPFESGMDWKPTFDVPLGFGPGRADKSLFGKVVKIDFRNYLNNYSLQKIREQGYFLVKEVGLNTIYAQNLRVMAKLCDMVEDTASARYHQLAERVEKSILSVMYDEEDEAFYDCFGKEDEKIKILTPTIFYPVILESTPVEVRERVLKKHFYNSEEFSTTFVMPSLAINEPAFDPEESIYIWRGPTWIVHNWFLHRFFLQNGHRKEAAQLVDSIRKLIDKSGFREYYNPFTGQGYGAKEFTWCGLIIDMMASEESAEK